MKMRLFTPGPVTVPQDIVDAASAQPLYHRSPEFMALSRSVWANLQTVFQTHDPVVVLGGSGMSGIEAAMIAAHAPGEHIVILEHGRFGQRLTQIARIHGLVPHVLSVPWGETISPDLLADHLNNLLNDPLNDPLNDLCGVWFVHAETSTGVLLDAGALTSTIRARCPDALIGMDAVTSIGIHDVKVDAWQVDMAITGVQKGLMCPPGLACVSISERAEQRLLSNPRRSYSLDLHTVLDHQREGLFTWTPPVTLVAALGAALDRILNEGLDHVWARQAASAEIVRQGARQLGLKLFGAATSNAVTVIEHRRSNEIRRELRDVHHMLVAGGQDQLSGKVFRIGTCGSITPTDAHEITEALRTVFTHLA